MGAREDKEQIQLFLRPNFMAMAVMAVMAATAYKRNTLY